MIEKGKLGVIPADMELMNGESRGRFHQDTTLRTLHRRKALKEVMLRGRHIPPTVPSSFDSSIAHASTKFDSVAAQDLRRCEGTYLSYHVYDCKEALRRIWRSTQP